MQLHGLLKNLEETLWLLEIHLLLLFFHLQSNIPEFDKVGKTDNSGGGGNFNSAFVHYLVFDCYTPIQLVSVKVFAASAGNRLIKLNDASGSLIDQRIVNIPQGESRIILDFEIPAGSDYQLAGPESPDLYRNNDGLIYPYDLYGIASVKYSSANTNPTGYYYYFYDWEIMESNCVSERVVAYADVLDIPIADFSFINDSGFVTFANSSEYSSEYLWDFGDGTTSTLENPGHSYSTVGNYTVTLISTNNCGSDTIDYNIEITITEIEDIADISNLEIYPNPVCETLYISFSNSDEIIKNIELFDILGNIIWVERDISKFSDYSGQINMKGFSKGVYYLRINMDNSFISEKVIHQ